MTSYTPWGNYRFENNSDVLRARGLGFEWAMELGYGIGALLPKLVIASGTNMSLYLNQHKSLEKLAWDRD